jgi:hypothetical protein
MLHPSVGGAEMGIYDVNGDGLNDVVTALNAHGWGLAWFEQKRDKEGAISFVKHYIMGDFSTKNTGDMTFSELHGVAFGVSMAAVFRTYSRESGSFRIWRATSIPILTAPESCTGIEPCGIRKRRVERSLVRS